MDWNKWQCKKCLEDRKCPECKRCENCDDHYHGRMMKEMTDRYEAQLAELRKLQDKLEEVYPVVAAHIKRLTPLEGKADE